MLKTLEIKNFQSHRYSSLEFHPGMNVITGSSDSGKSAIIRAMIWALKNRPSGESFKTWNAKPESSVNVNMEFDNDWFEKSRSNGKNKYGCDKGTFEALRSDVPEEISNISQISDYNLQTQFQPYFMLQDSAGDRAKQLNSLVGLDIIDTILKKLNGKILTIKTSIKLKETELSRVEEELSELSYIDGVALLAESIDSSIKTYEKTRCRANALLESIDILTEIDAQIAERSKILSAERSLQKLNSTIAANQCNKDSIKQLNLLIENLDSTEGRIIEDKEWLKVEIPYSSILNLMKDKFVMDDDIVGLRSLAKTADDIWRKCIGAESDLEELVSEYSDKLQDAEVCPTCMAKIDSKTIENIKRRIL